MSPAGRKPGGTTIGLKELQAKQKARNSPVQTSMGRPKSQTPAWGDAGKTIALLQASTQTVGQGSDGDATVGGSSKTILDAIEGVGGATEDAVGGNGDTEDLELESIGSLPTAALANASSGTTTFEKADASKGKPIDDSHSASPNNSPGDSETVQPPASDNQAPPVPASTNSSTELTNVTRNNESGEVSSYGLDGGTGVSGAAGSSHVVHNSVTGGDPIPNDEKAAGLPAITIQLLAEAQAAASENGGRPAIHERTRAGEPHPKPANTPISAEATKSIQQSTELTTTVSERRQVDCGNEGGQGTKKSIEPSETSRVDGNPGIEVDTKGGGNLSKAPGVPSFSVTDDWEDEGDVVTTDGARLDQGYPALVDTTIAGVQASGSTQSNPFHSSQDTGEGGSPNGDGEAGRRSITTGSGGNGSTEQNSSPGLANSAETSSGAVLDVISGSSTVVDGSSGGTEESKGTHAVVPAVPKETETSVSGLEELLQLIESLGSVSPADPQDPPAALVERVKDSALRPAYEALEQSRKRILAHMAMLEAKQTPLSRPAPSKSRAEAASSAATAQSQSSAWSGPSPWPMATHFGSSVSNLTGFSFGSTFSTESNPASAPQPTVPNPVPQTAPQWDDKELKEMRLKISSLNSTINSMSQAVSRIVKQEDLTKGFEVLGDKLARAVAKGVNEAPTASGTATNVDKIEKGVSQMAAKLETGIADLQQQLKHLEEVLAKRLTTPAATQARPSSKDELYGVTELETQLKDMQKVLDAATTELIQADVAFKIALEGDFSEEAEATVGSPGADGERDTVKVARGIKTKTLRLIHKCRALFRLIAGTAPLASSTALSMAGEWAECLQHLQARYSELREATRGRARVTRELQLFHMFVELIRRGFYTPSEWRSYLSGQELAELLDQPNDGLARLEALAQEVQSLRQSR
ncbi:hypothetical protein FRB90_005132, partial [Tulasnella sp. 427]